ncbi:cdc42 effector protein 4 [Scyliorhinus canicula]|uniref:cdc42 effector protein 4 n=1 Tax=Scyliorhinus canicula TaxID=7830 RepID=UPI0018F38DB3|nr:cdc42 effector protein 4 [Scyliorhinus canicula]XP_038633756.1 cdc42 effector protein 4 [Scyliorhinus canicula]XP_038633757.1 cdc42 effector protein 4 [Scyliorhinus canicula]XP_038633760.1 cdc42 effector protein 4 [Scyliorhinus canicula]XP_038633761.1 cdc42 effector protein 4 [Scyliorhinus canicula]XP_038633762.1 cdc42 effector protein 4 [Scyliorhinus canicula]
MPILKQLVASSNQSKRRSRIDLTTDMISAPLGDFRHTMHVGRGGDVFGDTSFLSSKVGAAAPTPPAEATPKPGLLSRKFRSSSKRSQSVTRVDKRDTLTQSDSAIFVKNAVSLPQLNDKTVEPTSQMAKSLSSSPLKKLASEQMEDKPVNGAVSIPESKSEYQDEREFGDITDLPASLSSGGFPLKHAESIMSFHVDLGPSMLSDILSVMEKDTWENNIDPGFGDDQQGPYPNSQKVAAEEFVEEPAVSTVALQSNINSVVYTASESHLSQDSGSVSSLASGTTEERRSVYEGVSHGDVDSMKNIGESRDAFREEENEDGDFTFMDEEDEIRV